MRKKSAHAKHIEEMWLQASERAKQAAFRRSSRDTEVVPNNIDND